MIPVATGAKQITAQIIPMLAGQPPRIYRAVIGALIAQMIREATSGPARRRPGGEAAA